MKVMEGGDSSDVTLGEGVFVISPQGLWVIMLLQLHCQDFN